jgi:hypothetical protein
VEKILLIYIVVQSGDATPLVERIKLNSESVEAHVEYRNTCFDAVINAHHSEFDEGTKMDVENSQAFEEEEDKSEKSIPLAAEVRDTPPLSPAYMITQNLIQRNQTQLQSLLNQQQTRSRTKQNTRKCVGGKSVKRRSKKKILSKISENFI